MNNGNLKQTRFDSIVSNREMQLAKAAIPYIDNNLGVFIGAYIKLIELQNITRISPSRLRSSDANIFDDIKDYLDDETRDTFEMLFTLMEVMKNEDNSADDIINNYMSMFNL